MSNLINLKNLRESSLPNSYGGVSIIGCVVALCLISLCGLVSWRVQSETGFKSRDVVINNLPDVLNSWVKVDEQPLDVMSREILNLSRFIRRSYKKNVSKNDLFRPEDGLLQGNKDVVSLYIGYWEKQTGDSQAAKHSPRLCLPSNGWVISSSGKEKIQIGQDELEYQSIVALHDQQATLFHYWFFSGETTYHQDWKALITISIEKFFRGRSDGGIVEVYTPIRGDMAYGQALEEAKARLIDFKQAMYPALDGIIKSKD